MASKFNQDDAFLVITRVIVEIHQETNHFVTHDETVQGILNDPAGRNLVESACEADDGTKSREWWASNMIQWFSQRITEERSEYKDRFERTKIDGAWAYRPTT